MSSHNPARHTRRDFLKDTVVLAGAGFAAETVVPATAMPSSSRETSRTVSRQSVTYVVYVSFQGDDTISIFRMDRDTGKLTVQEHVSVDGGPAPMTIDPGKNFLYVGKRASQELSSYRIDRSTGGLSLVGTVPLQGDPVYVSTDRTGRFVLSAYFYQSTVGVHAVNGEGVLAFPPREWRYTANAAHAINTDPSNRYAFVPHVDNRAGAGCRLDNRGGPNAIFQFKFDAATGRLTSNDPPMHPLQEKVGPRAICFHPTLDVLYSSDEQGSSATAYDLDPSTGVISHLQTISTLPPGYSETNTCSQIQISPSGEFLYVPNRGHDSIASFIIDSSTGRLTATGRVPTEAGPRAFSLDPKGNFLLVSGRESGRLASYRVDQDSGELTPLEIYEGGDRCMWVSIIELT